MTWVPSHRTCRNGCHCSNPHYITNDPNIAAESNRHFYSNIPEYRADACFVFSNCVYCLLACLAALCLKLDMGAPGQLNRADSWFWLRSILVWVVRLSPTPGSSLAVEPALRLSLPNLLLTPLKKKKKGWTYYHNVLGKKNRDKQAVSGVVRR